VGIDVSKAQLDLAVHRQGTPQRLANDADGIAALVAQLATQRPRLIVLEAVGAYEAACALALQAAALPVLVVNPRQARAFARSQGILCKTDRGDARVLAPSPPPRRWCPGRCPPGRCVSWPRWSRAGARSRNSWGPNAAASPSPTAWSPQVSPLPSPNMSASSNS